MRSALPRADNATPGLNARALLSGSKHGLPGRDDRPAHRRAREAALPFAQNDERVTNARGRDDHRTSDHRRDGPGHEPLCQPSARGQVGEDLPRQPRTRRQMPLRPQRQRQPAPACRADRGHAGRRPHQGHLLRAQYEEIKRRHGHNKAIVAVAHSILIAAYYILRDDVPCHELGCDYFAGRSDPEPMTRRLPLAHTREVAGATAANCFFAHPFIKSLRCAWARLRY